MTMPFQTLFVFTFSLPVNFRIQSHKWTLNRPSQTLCYVFIPISYAKLKPHFFSVSFLFSVSASLSLFLFLFSICLSIIYIHTIYIIYIYIIYIYYIYIYIYIWRLWNAWNLFYIIALLYINLSIEHSFDSTI